MYYELEYATVIPFKKINKRKFGLHKEGRLLLCLCVGRRIWFAARSCVGLYIIIWLKNFDLVIVVLLLL